MGQKSLVKPNLTALCQALDERNTPNKKGLRAITLSPYLLSHC